jgi:hypothetical protein
LVYLDEAGISKNERILSVGAVVVHGDKQLIGVQRHLDRLVERWIPKSLREGFVFHATEIFHGGKMLPREAFPLQTRLQMAEALAAVPKKHGLKLGLGALDKRQHDERADIPGWHDASDAERAIFAHASAFSACVIGVDQWLRKHHPDEVCVLVAEDNDQARKTIREVIRFQQKKDSPFAQGGNYGHLFPLKRIMEDPLFSPKKPSSVLQLADFWAYVAKKRFGGDAHFNRYWDLMRPCLVPAIFEWAPPE